MPFIYSLPALLCTDLTLLALAGASVGVGALAVDRKALAVTEAAVAADLHQAGNVLTNLATEVTLGGEVRVDVVANLRHVVLGEVLDAGVGIHASLSADLGSAGLTDAIEIRKTNLNALLAGKVNAVDTCQLRAPLLALTLLVARVLADHVNLAMATNDLALVAHLLDRRTYLHFAFPFGSSNTNWCCSTPQVVLRRLYVLAQPQA